MHTRTIYADSDEGYLYHAALASFDVITAWDDKRTAGNVSHCTALKLKWVNLKFRAAQSKKRSRAKSRLFERHSNVESTEMTLKGKSHCMIVWNQNIPQLDLILPINWATGFTAQISNVVVLGLNLWPWSVLEDKFWVLSLGLEGHVFGVEGQVLVTRTLSVSVADRIVKLEQSQSTWRRRTSARRRRRRTTSRTPFRLTVSSSRAPAARDSAPSRAASPWRARWRPARAAAVRSRSPRDSTPTWRRPASAQSRTRATRNARTCRTSTNDSATTSRRYSIHVARQHRLPSQWVIHEICVIFKCFWLPVTLIFDLFRWKLGRKLLLPRRTFAPIFVFLLAAKKQRKVGLCLVLSKT